MSENEYPATRYVRVRSDDPRARRRFATVAPLKAPLGKADPLEAYAPFAFATLDEARRAHAEDMVHLWQMIADGDLPFEEAEAEDARTGIFVCEIHEDGSITCDDFALSREKVFAAYEVEDPLAAAAPTM